MVKEAHGEGKPVSICGEMAGDPAAAMLLLAMGFDSLSMNATNPPKVKWLLRQISMDTAQQLLAASCCWTARRSSTARCS